MLEAFEGLGIAKEERNDILQLCAAVLHLGNVTYEVAPSGQGCICTQSPQCLAAVNTCQNLLQTQGGPEVLQKCLTVRDLVIRGEHMNVELTPEQARDARDALAKDLYGRLFDWIVVRLNKEMAAVSPPSGGTNIVGILDIFGFEIFKVRPSTYPVFLKHCNLPVCVTPSEQVNSFEQFCINFCNEKLQNHFNETTFKNEEETYIAEKVEFTKVQYVDNQDVLDLIEGKGGIMGILDDEIWLPKSTDDSFLQKITKEHAQKVCCCWW